MQYDRVQRTLVLVLVLNVTVAVAKGIAGLMAGSVSMVADAFHSTFDSLSNVIGIISTQLAKQPPDQTHPYGHGRIETFGALIIGIMLMITSIWIVIEGIDRLTTRQVPEITGLTIGVMIGTIIINIFVSEYERRVGERLQSQILLADAAHTRSDIWVSLSVLGGFVVITLGYPEVDPLIAFVIGLLIAKMGVRIIRTSGEVLTDARVIDCESRVAQIVRSIRGVRGYHKFRCRGKPQELFADIHVLVDPQLSVAEGHEIAEMVRIRLLEEVNGMEDVIVHIDPDIPERKTDL